MGDSESDDSDAENGLGNVSRVVMRPPGHSGKAKKGHLCFDASFETGNLGKVDLVSDFEYDLYIRPDTCNPYHRIWFNFVVDNTKADQRVFFHIVNVSKHKCLFVDGMTPIVRSTSRKQWRRMPPHQVYFYRSPYHNEHYVLTLSFCFDKEEDSYQFSYNYPYSYSKCQAHLETIEKRNLLYFEHRSLTNTLQNRRINLVTITNPARENIKKRVVFILSRIHPGDAPSSFICQGIIDFLISHHPMVKQLRDSVIFKIVPMLNPDGVVLGNYRSNLLGADFNRTWNRVSKYLHPPLYAVINMMDELKNNKDVELDFVIDLHAHCSLAGVFVHGHAYEDVYRHERHTLFPKLLSRNVDGYENEYCIFNRDRRKRGSCKRYFSSIKEMVNCYSVYASFYGYFHKNTKKFVHFTEDAYYRLGRNIVRTFHHYYSFLGVITSQSTTQPSPNCKMEPVFQFLHKRSRKRVKKRKKGYFKISKKSLKKCEFRRNKRKMVEKEVIAVDTKTIMNTRKVYVDFDFSQVQFPPLLLRNQVFNINPKLSYKQVKGKNNDSLNVAMTQMNITGSRMLPPTQSENR